MPSRFPSGTNPSGLAFVGEAPARNEIRQGEPFVGPSGKLLNAVLTHYGVDRNNVLLTNACLCHYPDSMKELPKDAIECCKPRLMQELLDANVDTVVTMGNSASTPLLPKEEVKRGITKLRAGPPKRTIVEGHRLDSDDNPHRVEVDLVCTFHPAYCLRSQAMFPLMLGDISKALHKERPILWYEPNIIVLEEGQEDDALRWIQYLDDVGEPVVVDTESGRDKDTSYGRDDGPYGRILCIGVGPTSIDNEHDVVVFADSVLANYEVRRTLSNLFKRVGLVTQNGKYDVGVLMNYLDEEEPFPLTDDTMLASYCLYEVGGIHGLKYMGVELLGTPNWDDEIKPYISKDQGYATIPRDMLYRYNAYDVHVTRILRGYFSNLIEEQGMVRLYRWLVDRVSPMLTKVEARGMGFDLERSKELEIEYADEIEYLEGKLPFNPRSWQQVKAWLLERGIDTPSTDEEHLTRIADHKRTPDEVRDTAQLILDSRGVSKLKGTYVDGPQKKLTVAGRVHTSYLIHGTTTGRLSSRGPNLQNIPRSGPIKEQFVPRPGHLLIGLDYAQAELRVLTWLAHEPFLRDVFADPNKDLFTELCIKMIPGYADMDKDRQKYYRTLIKTFVYGVSYGRTAAGVASDSAFNMTVGEAQGYMDEFMGTIPNVAAFQADVRKRIHAGEDLINAFGRHRRFYLITEANKTSVENEAMAYLPQSTASDIGLEAACRISQEGIFLVNLVHDALYAEALPDEVDEVITLMDKIMVSTGEEITEGYVKFKTDAKVGKRWSDV